MSYLVLARKWRPNTFDEVVGQGHVTRTLKNAIERDRVAHALLFTGSRGIGKTSCARILAKSLNCVNGPTIEPCGVCAACVEISGGTSVDVFEVDGASNNSVEQIREIRESVKFLPSKGKRKMYIIDEVHMLTTSAFNALLKTLEEPPEHVLFVFATTEPHKIPDTILSRCQRYDFKRVPERDIVGALTRIAAAEEITIDPQSLHHIAREAKGGMRDSLSLFDQVIAFCGTTIDEGGTREVLGIADRKILTDLTAAVLAGDGSAALDVVDALFRFGLDLQKFASEFVKHLRDLMVIRVCEHPERLVDLPPTELSDLAAQVADVAPARIHRLFNAFMQGAEEVARSPFPKLVFEMTLLRLCEQGPTLPIAEVLAGLGRLEARLDAPLGAAPARGATRAPTAPAASPTSTQTSRAAEPAPGSAGPTAQVRSAPEPSAGPGAESSAPRHDWQAPTGEAPAPPTQPRPAPVVEAPRPQIQSAPAPERAPMMPPAAPLEHAPSAPTPPTDPAGRRAANGYLLPSLEPWPVSVAWGEPAPSPVVEVDEVATPPFEPDPPAVLPRAVIESADDGEITITEPLKALDLSDGDDPMAAFDHLIEQLSVRHGFLAGELCNDAILGAFEPRRLALALPVARAEELAAVEEALGSVAGEILGGAVEVELAFCEPGDQRLVGETLFQWRKQRARERREARKLAARNDPAVAACIAAFGAEVLDIDPR